MNRSVLLIALLATSLPAAVVTHHEQTGTTVVASKNKLRTYDRAMRVVSEVSSVESPSSVLLTADGDIAFVVDRGRETLRVIDLISGATKSTASLMEMPVDPQIIDDILFYIGRETPALHAVTAGGRFRRFDLPFQATMLRSSSNALFAYSALDGRLARIDASTLRLKEVTTIRANGSDMIADDRHLYIAYPRAGVVSSLAFAPFGKSADVKIGAVPIDVELGSDSNGISAGEIVVADPASKQLFRAEREQSVGAATARGFARGLIGLGLYKPRSTSFPSGIDRIWPRGSVTLAYDSSSRTLFRVTGKQVAKILTGVDADEFAVTSRGQVIAYDDESGARIVGDGTPVAVSPRHE